MSAHTSFLSLEWRISVLNHLPQPVFQALTELRNCIVVVIPIDFLIVFMESAERRLRTGPSSTSTVVRHFQSNAKIVKPSPGLPHVHAICAIINCVHLICMHVRLACCACLRVRAAPQFRSRAQYITMATTGYNPFKMAALNLEAPPSSLKQSMPGAVSTRRLEGTLVTPWVTKPVPNHLADTSKCNLV